MNDEYNQFFEMISTIDELIKENDDKDDDDYLKNLLNIKGNDEHIYFNFYRILINF